MVQAAYNASYGLAAVVPTLDAIRTIAPPCIAALTSNPYGLPAPALAVARDHSAFVLGELLSAGLASDALRPELHVCVCVCVCVYRFCISPLCKATVVSMLQMTYNKLWVATCRRGVKNSSHCSVPQSRRSAANCMLRAGRLTSSARRFRNTSQQSRPLGRLDKP